MSWPPFFFTFVFFRYLGIFFFHLFLVISKDSSITFDHCGFLFRDGVSESQFNQVLNIELDQIIKVMINPLWLEEHYWLFVEVHEKILRAEGHVFEEALVLWYLTFCNLSCWMFPAHSTFLQRACKWTIGYSRPANDCGLNFFFFF